MKALARLAAARFAVATVALALGAVVIVAAEVPARDTSSALDLGNSLFRDGRFEDAVSAYRQGWDPSHPSATLPYNLGTTLHHLDRLPEAILWYRRAAGAGDPWLDDNLFLARRTLGSRSLPPGGLLGVLAQIAGPLAWTAVVLAWVGLLAWIATPRFATAGLGVAGLALVLWLGSLAGSHLGPRAVVVLEDCSSDGGELPAGSEAWASRDGDGAWRISGSSDVVCPPEAAEAVFPDG